MEPLRWEYHQCFQVARTACLQAAGREGFGYSKVSTAEITPFTFACLVAWSLNENETGVD